MFEAIEEKYGIKTGDYIPQVEIQENWIPVFKFNPPPPPTYQVQLQSKITGLQDIINSEKTKMEELKVQIKETESKLEEKESKMEEKDEDLVFLNMEVERLREDLDITDNKLNEAVDNEKQLVNYQNDPKTEHGAVVVREHGALVSQILKETASAWKEFFFIMLDDIKSFFITKEKEKIETLETAEANLSKATSLLIRYPKNEARQLEVDIADDKLNLAYINEINNTKDDFLKNKLRRKLYKGLRTIPTVKKESKGKTIESEKDLDEIQKEIKTRLSEKEKKLDDLNTTRAEPAPSGGIWSWLFSAPAAPAAATDGSNTKQLPPPTRYSKRIQRAKNSRKNRVASKKKAKRSISRSKKRRLKGSPKKNRKSKDGGITVETPITPFNTCKVFKAL
jgi:hypothetical protein